MEPSFVFAECYRVEINFTDDVMPVACKVSGYSDSGEMLRLYWYEKDGHKVHEKFFPLFNIKSVDVESIQCK